MNSKYKTKILGYTLITLILFTIASCKKDLQSLSKESLNDQIQWSNESTADIFLNDIYGSLPRWDDTPDFLDSYTDDNVGGVYWPSWNNWKNGPLTPTTPAFTYSFLGTKYSDWADWSNAFTQIRKCNTFIQKVNENSANYKADWKMKRIDEARFIRAFHYNNMMQHFGGLPIITRPQEITEGNGIKLPRNTFEETVNFITAELDTIVKDGALPVKYSSGDPNTGRATLGAALALKGWVELFAASPGFNTALPAAADGTGATTDQIKLVGYGNFDAQRWAKAAATNKQFIDTYEGTYKLFSDLSKFWAEANEYNSEVIFDMQYIKYGNLSSNIDVFSGPVYILGKGISWGNFQPTEELVETFGMANGKPITDSTSGYDVWNPYLNRDPRFYKWIVYDGAPYKMDWMPTTDTIYTRVDSVLIRKKKKSKGYDNQIDLSHSDNTCTGYYAKKRLSPDVTPYWGADGQNYVYLRYAEVLLNYAEAQNEAVGPDGTVYAAIDKIRARSNVPSLELAYGALSQAQMRDVIHNERRVELCYENKRFYDIIRWKIAENVLNAEAHGMLIKNTVSKDNSGVWKYNSIVIGLAHHFTNNMYLCPIPQNVMDRNSKLIQNPGY